MTNLLEFKEKLNHFYAKYGRFIWPVFKFIIAFIVFTLINQNIGYDQRLNNGLAVMALSIVGAFLPSTVLVLMAALFTAVHVYYVSVALSVILIMLFLILYFLCIRFMKNSGYVVLAVPILYLLKVPFAVPILLGLIAGPLSIIPMSCGIIVYYLFKIIKGANLVANGTSVEDILGVYKYVVDHVISNKEMILVIIVFGVTLLLTYFIRNLSIDYAFHFAILVGALANVLAFLIGGLILTVAMNLTFIIAGSAVSGVIVLIIQFFRLNLDYSTVEFTQFEDDDYYYYVKAVPKVKITVPKKDVKRINGENHDKADDAISESVEELER
ncbi:hypothetical protein [[Clostridium] polysaccharolyticum]|jgi:hypothetical protein|uniref:Uncharacterized protein n=1 Tax=[Clostridium] polysaccharolyticum TaxID=29364 RepID=A0A1H9ZCI9_9FIRM|nr:hypothetical protein [[Clostridium] polysaccharolyticum]SES79340.1 hypothetical protein SAMN04487772_103136 [[Clostridium] polysaccharolyticum]